MRDVVSISFIFIHISMPCRSTLQKRRIAELLSQLPGELDVEKMVSVALCSIHVPAVVAQTAIQAAASGLASGLPRPTAVGAAAAVVKPGEPGVGKCAMKPWGHTWWLRVCTRPMVGAY